VGTGITLTPCTLNTDRNYSYLRVGEFRRAAEKSKAMLGRTSRRGYPGLSSYFPFLDYLSFADGIPMSFEMARTRADRLCRLADLLLRDSSGRNTTLALPL
jgi:hypothetical protein